MQHNHHTVNWCSLSYMNINVIIRSLHMSSISGHFSPSITSIPLSLQCVNPSLKECVGQLLIVHLSSHRQTITTDQSCQIDRTPAVSCAQSSSFLFIHTGTFRSSKRLHSSLNHPRFFMTGSQTRYLEFLKDVWWKLNL